jgi:F-type H+-transporting ATPase subunit delta
MALETTVARPYAEAAFDTALSANSLAEWADALALGAMIVADERVNVVLQSPRVDDDRKASLIIEVSGKTLNEHQGNFIRLLVNRDRITLLPEIRAQFDDLRATHERTLTAELTTAQPVDAAAAEGLASALSKRLERKVTLETRIDETLIGGAVIRAGDLVIDGSVRGRLAGLTGALSR